MGFIIIDEEQLNQRISLWNSPEYKNKVLSDVNNSKADYSCLLPALQAEEKRIEEQIEQLKNKKEDISQLMKYAKLC